MSPIREPQMTVSILRRHRSPKIVSLAIVAGLLVACADESGPLEDRRFANEPATRIVELATPTDLPRQTPAPTMPPLGSPEAMLNVHDAPEIIFVATNGSIDVIDTVNVDQRRSIVVDAAQIIDFASSPGGNRVAVLTKSFTESGAVDVVVFERDGQEVRRWTDLGELAPAGATPVMSSGGDASSGGFITWASEADRLLVSTNGSDLISIEIAGSPQRLSVPARVQTVEHAAWSPLGDQIGLLARDEDGTGAIWVMDPFVDGVSLRQVTPPDADAFNLGSVTRFAWLPDGSGFVYILAVDVGISNQGGQLYAYNLQENQRVLVAAPGQGGPSAQIVDFEVSPDGLVVAYTISIPTGDQWQFHSLWVRSLETSNVYRVPVAQTERITEMWWSEAGLVWRQQTGNNLDIVLKAESADVEFLREHGDEVMATPISGSTPSASPVIATPDAASPVATSDAATPIRGTPDIGTPVATAHTHGTPRDQTG